MEDVGEVFVEAKIFCRAGKESRNRPQEIFSALDYAGHRSLRAQKNILQAPSLSAPARPASALKGAWEGGSQYLVPEAAMKPATISGLDAQSLFPTEKHQ